MQNTRVLCFFRCLFGLFCGFLFRKICLALFQQIGQQLKIVKGPFHAVVSKSAFRMDVYAGPTPAPSSIGTSGLGAGAEPGWVYIRSFNVGLTVKF